MQQSHNIKNKKRVADHGEVFTAEKEVEAMLDLVKNETHRIDSSFLEPACGNGNFLVKILVRKLEVIKQKYQKNQIEFEHSALIAVASIYGVDILQDNVLECRERLYKIFYEIYQKIFGKKINEIYLENIKFILEKNILWGDALSLMQVNNKQPITFCEWVAVNNFMIKRKDFELANLLAYRTYNEHSLFSDLGEKELIPKAKKEFQLMHFMELKNMEQNDD